MTKKKVPRGGPFRRKPSETEYSFFTGLGEAERARAVHIGQRLGDSQAERLMTHIALQEPQLQGVALHRAVIEAISTLASRMLIENVASERIGEALDLVKMLTRKRTRCDRFRRHLPLAGATPPESRPPAGRAHQRPTRVTGRPARGPAESTRRFPGCRRPFGSGGTR